MLESKRKFLIATANEKLFSEISRRIGKHISGASFLHAEDGSQALFKISNDMPHILILDESLHKLSASQLLESLFENRRYEDMAVILLSEIPEVETFVDEVVKGRLQYLHQITDDELLAKCLARALNFLTQKVKAEFRLKFLAPGEVLVEEGTAAEFVYILKHGKLKATTQRENQIHILGEISPGEFVGEMAYFNGEQRSASVVAIEDSELIEIPINHLDQLLFQKPVWSRALMRTLTKRLKLSNAAAKTS
jgi:CRP/FNR family cyclic AMP-dependent transcriptional regulator